MNSAVPSNKEISTWTTKQVVFVTIFVVCVFLAFWLFYRLRLVILLFFVAAVLGTAIRPAVEWLHRRTGMSRVAGIMTLYAAAGILLAGFFYLVLPLLADQVTQVTQDLPSYYSAARGWLLNSGNRLLQIIGARIPPALAFWGQASTDPTAEEVLDQVAQTMLYFSVTARSLFSILAVFLLAFYWTQESHKVYRSVLLLVPLPRRKGVREFIELAEAKIGGYVRGQGILSLVVGSAALIAYSLIGLPFTLVLAVIAGIMEMIPIVGPVLGAIPALLVALSVDPSKAIWVLAATGVIQLLENAYLVPRIMKNSMGVNPIIILLSLVGFSSVLGFVGALLALPLAAIVQLIIDRVVQDVSDAQAAPSRTELDMFTDESQRLIELAGQGIPRTGPANKPESGVDGTEIRGVLQELGGLIKQLQQEEE